MKPEKENLTLRWLLLLSLLLHFMPIPRPTPQPVAFLDLASMVADTRGAETTLEITSPMTLPASVTVPLHVKLVVKKGGFITCGPYTLTINGQFEAPLSRVFSGAVFFGSRRTVPAEWWLGSDYGESMSAAIASIRAVGGKITYQTDGVAVTPINATGLVKGVIFEGLGGHANAPVIAGNHSGIVFDASGSCDLVFRDFLIGSGGTTPSVGYLFGRTVDGYNSARCAFYNSGVTLAAQFSRAAYYSYAAEENYFYDARFSNACPGAATAVFSTGNALGVGSSFKTLVTGNQSMSVVNIFGGRWQNTGGANSNVFLLDGCTDFRVEGGFWYNPLGYAYVKVSSANAASDRVSICGVRGEVAPEKPVYGIYFDNAAARTHAFWVVERNVFDVQTRTVYASDNASLAYVHYRANNDVGACGISLRNLRDAYLWLDGGTPVEGRLGGLVQMSEIWGYESAMSFLWSINFTTIHDLVTGAQIYKEGFEGGVINEITLAANAAETVCACVSVRANSKIVLTPSSANAAANLVGTYVLASDIVPGVSFKIRHANTAHTDKTFNYHVFSR